MIKGDQVRVYPHGSPALAATGAVLLISENQRSIVVNFDHVPPFAFRAGADPIAVHAEHGVVLLAGRYAVGPWVELSGGGHYEIEEIE